jgi:hypothetical protein
VDDDDALPSYVCLLELNHFCSYGAADKHARATLNIAARDVLDSPKVIDGPMVAAYLAVDWIMPMMMMTGILRGGGIGLMAFKEMVHGYQEGGRRGEGGANRSGDRRRRGMEPQPRVPFMRPSIPVLGRSRISCTVRVFIHVWID